jgi:predicted Zn-dependent peptidase
MKKMSRLPNGITVFTERLPTFRMAHVQCCFHVGSGTEATEEWGAAHFLEHLLFSGRTEEETQAFMTRMARLGAVLNASTAMDHTVFSLDAPPETLVAALGLLLEKLGRWELVSEAFERERQVILEEQLSKAEDWNAFGVQQFYQAIAGDYGHEVLGTEESIREMTPDRLRRFHANHYTPDRLVIGAAGCVEHEEIMEVVAKHFGGLQGAGAPKRRPRLLTPGRVHIPAEADLVQVFLGFPAPSYATADRDAFAVLTRIFAGDGTDMWARLFRRVRKQLALSYVIGGEYTFLEDVGLFLVYAETRPETVGQLLSTIEQERIALGEGVTEEELACGVAVVVSEQRGLDDRLPDRVTKQLKQVLFGRDLHFQNQQPKDLSHLTLDNLRMTWENYLKEAPLLVLTIGEES